MALMQQTMTEKNLAAHQRNARQSHGAATPEGKERARAANLRHGYYSQLRDEVLVALGDDPETLAALVEGARQQFRPANAYQTWITDRLASLQLSIDRAERMQESKAAAHIRQFEAKRQQAARQLREQCADIEDFLGSLQRAAARPDFYTPTRCIERCREVIDKNPSAAMDQIFDLLHELRRPRRFTEPPPAPLPDALSDPEWQEVLNNDQAWQEILINDDDEAAASSVPDPEIEDEGGESSDSDIEVAQGKERDPLREQLWNLAGEERRRAAEAWRKAIAAQEAPLSTRTRDLLVLEISKEMELLRREERACFREFWRLGNDLRKLQKESALPDRKPDGQPGNQASRGQGAGGEEGAGEEPSKNAGASGYVEEKTSELKGAVAAECPPAARQAEPEPVLSHDTMTELSQAPAATAPTNPPQAIVGHGKTRRAWGKAA